MYFLYASDFHLPMALIYNIISLVLAEGDMLAQNASNPGITMDLFVSISNKWV